MLEHGCTHDCFNEFLVHVSKSPTSWGSASAPDCYAIPILAFGTSHHGSGMNYACFPSFQSWGVEGWSCSNLLASNFLPKSLQVAGPHPFYKKLPRPKGLCASCVALEGPSHLGCCLTQHSRVWGGHEALLGRLPHLLLSSELKLRQVECDVVFATELDIPALCPLRLQVCK